MGRMNWGGRQDLSGVFASLQAAYQRDVEADVANARARAAEEQAAEDREMHAKWMAGKISDEEWLAHLEMRVEGSLDAEERSQYTEMLLEHRGAIQDAQMEARFAMGQISQGQLMNHYSKRMGSVDKNSPAWRELAMRYGQLRGGGSGYGGGGGGGGGRGGRGGRGGGSGSGSADPAAVVQAGLDVYSEGEMFKGIHTSGPDVIDPTMSLRPLEDDDDLINSLLSDIERIEQIETYAEEHPTDRTVIDEATGEEFEVNSDFWVELDKQYIRSQQALAAAYFARGDSEDDKKGVQALGYATRWVAGAMTRHNTQRAEPHVQAMEQFVFAELVAASNLADPEDRRRAYASTQGAVREFLRNNVTGRANPASTQRATGDVRYEQTSDLPDALRPDDDVYTRAQVLLDVLDLGANANRMTPDEINARADAILSQSSTIGGEGSTISIETLLTGPGEGGFGSGSVPADFIGLLETNTQIQGLEAGRRILAGNPDPEYDGPIYVYAYDGERTRAVVADVRDQSNAAGGVNPILVPQGDDPNSLVATRVRVGNRTETVWATPQPIDDPRFRVYRRRNGELLTSDEIKEMGPARLQALVGQGEFQVDSILTGVKLPDGRVWFRDNDTGMYHLQPPVAVETDPETGGVLVGKDREAVINPMPFAQGVITPFAGVSAEDMQRWTERAIATGAINPLAFRQRGPGGQVVELEGVGGMYFVPEDKGARNPSLLLEDRIAARERVSEETFMNAGGNVVEAVRRTDAQRERPSRIEQTQQAAERMGIQIFSNRFDPQREAQKVQAEKQPIWAGAERVYGAAVQAAMTAIQARNERGQNIWDLLAKKQPTLPKVEPPSVKPPVALLQADRANIKKYRAPRPPAPLPVKPMPQYKPSSNAPASTPGSGGGATLV